MYVIQLGEEKNKDYRSYNQISLLGYFSPAHYMSSYSEKESELRQRNIYKSVAACASVTSIWVLTTGGLRDGRVG